MDLDFSNGDRHLLKAIELNLTNMDLDSYYKVFFSYSNTVVKSNQYGFRLIFYFYV